MTSKRRHVELAAERRFDHSSGPDSILAMSTLSPEELAEKAGVSGAEIERMVGLGVIAPQGSTSTFNPSDVQKIRVALACEEAGLPAEGIGSAIAAGHLSFAFLETIWYQQFAQVSGRTLDDVAREAGLAIGSIARVLAAFGFAEKGPDDRFGRTSFRSCL